MLTRRRWSITGRLLAALLAVVTAAARQPAALASTGWPIGAGPGGGAARAGSLGQPNPTAICTSPVLGNLYVSWGAVTGAVQYQVLVYLNSSYDSTVTVSATSWTLSGVAAGTYYFEVRAVAGIWIGPLGGPTASHIVTSVGVGVTCT